MGKRKAESDVAAVKDTGAKKVKHAIADQPKVEARQNLLDSDSSGDEESDSGGVSLEAEFTVNKEYARRFEYNKKREELAKRESAPVSYCGRPSNISQLRKSTKKIRPSRSRASTETNMMRRRTAHLMRMKMTKAS